MVLWLTACVPVEAPLTDRHDAILNGATAATEARVFLLDLRFDNSTASICSAVLVSPRVLLTAAHCVDPAFHSATSVMVRATNKANDSMLMNSDMIPVSVITRHPSWDASQTMSDFDLAVLLLSSAPQGVTPAPMGTVPGNVIGQMADIVGYGRLTSGDAASSGTRRSLSVPVTASSAATLSFGSSTDGLCVGDSGGPLLLNGAVLSVHSRAEGGTCGAGVGIRVDTYRAFIDAFIAANETATCAMDSQCATNCPSPDPDCPCAADGTCNTSCGMTDPDCRCASDGACGAACGVSDVDCCKADGTCDAACGVADADCACVANGTCGAGCGTRDADCCATDGTCDAACGASDGDCRCVADASCDMSCGANGVNDPDCPCANNGTCTASCGATDPDCRCRDDGRCDPSCTPTDVDCANCRSDGVCVAACGISDLDCYDDGQVCSDAAACWGGLCERDPRGFLFCTRACTETSQCLNGMVCVSSVCRADLPPLGAATGGCSQAGATLGWAWLLLALLRGRRASSL